MTTEEQTPSPDDLKKVMRAMQIRTRNNALGHLERIGLRAFCCLRNLDLISDEAPPIGDEIDLAVLHDQKHARRQKLTEGPLVVYMEEGENQNSVVVELPVLLFSDDRNVRRAALECIEKSLLNDPLAITPKTVSILNESRDNLMAETPETWRPAAVIAWDALNDDILIALRGTQQSLECKPVLQDCLNFHTPKVIHPSVTSLDSINLPAGNPERDHEILAKLLTDIVSRSSSIAELCGAYLTNLGYLPLAPPFDLASAVSEWLASNASNDAWQEVWDWEETGRTPIAKYHACSIFVRMPELIPEGNIADLWKEILMVTQGSNNRGVDSPEYEPWTIRRDLARHYTYHMEARIPGNDGASIACFAWWLAEQFAGLFQNNVDSAKFYRENWVKPALNLSSNTWLIANAPIQHSFLRYVTISVQSPWALSLLALMGDHLHDLAPAEQAEEVQTSFNEILVTETISTLPFVTQNPDDPTYALECSIENTVLKWAEYQEEEHRIALANLVSMGRTLGTCDGLCHAMRRLGESKLEDQIIVCIALKAKVHTDPTIAASIWKIVSDPDWRQNVLAMANQEVQALLIESLIVFLVDERDKWAAHFPHYIAELCENEGDDKRKRVLFLYALHASLASDTVSAVHRLLKGEQKAKFVKYVKEYRARVESMRSSFPPWIDGKLRGLLASLHVL